MTSVIIAHVFGIPCICQHGTSTNPPIAALQVVVLSSYWQKLLPHIQPTECTVATLFVQSINKSEGHTGKALVEFTNHLHCNYIVNSRVSF